MKGREKGQHTALLEEARGRRGEGASWEGRDEKGRWAGAGEGRGAGEEAGGGHDCCCCCCGAGGGGEVGGV